MQRLSEEIRQKLRLHLRSLLTHESMTVENEKERNYVLDIARRGRVPVYTHKLSNGEGIVITRLTLAPIRKCPKCGYQAGALTQ